MTLQFFFLLLSLILALCAALGVPGGRVNLFAAAFASFVLSLMVTGALRIG